jgi:thiol-disulfide isomerase/thioredoxin
MVLAFWATWCGPCKIELPGLDRLYKRYSPDGIRFLAVNIEAAEMQPVVEAFVKTTGLQMPVAVDGGAIADRYHADSIPHLVILDGRGNVRRVFSGVHAEAEVAAAIDASR